MNINTQKYGILYTYVLCRSNVIVHVVLRVHVNVCYAVIFTNASHIQYKKTRDLNTILIDRIR